MFNKLPSDANMFNLVSAPSIFPLLWKISKGFLREDLRRRVEVFGGKQCDLLEVTMDEKIHRSNRSTEN